MAGRKPSMSVPSTGQYKNARRPSGRSPCHSITDFGGVAEVGGCDICATL